MNSEGEHIVEGFVKTVDNRIQVNRKTVIQTHNVYLFNYTQTSQVKWQES